MECSEDFKNGFRQGYYLNKNIIAWRHFAIKGALISLPMFVASTGLRSLG